MYEKTSQKTLFIVVLIILETALGRHQFRMYLNFGQSNQPSATSGKVLYREEGDIKDITFLGENNEFLVS